MEILTEETYSTEEIPDLAITMPISLQMTSHRVLHLKTHISINLSLSSTDWNDPTTKKYTESLMHEPPMFDQRV